MSLWSALERSNWPSHQLLQQTDSGRAPCGWQGALLRGFCWQSDMWRCSNILSVHHKMETTASFESTWNTSFSSQCVNMRANRENSLKTASMIKMLKGEDTAQLSRSEREATIQLGGTRDLFREPQKYLSGSHGRKVCFIINTKTILYH